MIRLWSKEIQSAVKINEKKKPNNKTQTNKPKNNQPKPFHIHAREVRAFQLQSLAVKN